MSEHFTLTSNTPPSVAAHDSGMTHVVIAPDNLSLVRDRTKCTRCGQCLDYCYRYGTVQGHRSSEGRLSCINCGQCSIHCETRSITERFGIEEFKAALADPDKIVIATTSPAVRVALGETFQMPPGSYVEEKMVASLKKLGCDYVLDTTFGADLTIMEEASELLRRLEKNLDSKYPLFTSCCPAWLATSGRMDGKGGLRSTTVWKRLQHVLSFFESMVLNDDLVKSPFIGMSMDPSSDEERNEYVEEELIYKSMAAAPDAEWRLIMALWRFAGLRGSTEPLLLRWKDILWKEKKIRAHSWKLRNHPKKRIRDIPMFAKLIEPLQQARAEADKDDVYVITGV